MTEVDGFDWAWTILPQISFYQLSIALIAGYPAFIAGMTSVYPVFAQAQPESRCPTELDLEPYSSMNLTFQQHQDVTGVKTSDSVLECEYWNKSADIENVWSSTNSPNLFLEKIEQLSKTHNYTVAYCDREDAIFDNSIFTSTLSTEFKLICDHGHFNAYATQASFVGLFIGAFCGGNLAEMFGRKRTMIVSVMLCALSLICQSLVPRENYNAGYWMFIVMRILVNAFNHMAYLSLCCYVTEVVGPNGRKITGMVPNFMFSFGYMFLSALSYWYRDWRDFTMAIGLISAPFVLTTLLWPESPRWLYLKGKIGPAEQVISTFIRRTKPSMVKFESDQDFLDQLRDQVDRSSGESDEPVERGTFGALFKTSKAMTLITLNVMFQFIGVTMAYYGLVYGAGSLPGSIFSNNVINGAVELVAYILCAAFLDKLGRRALLAGPLFFGGVACIGGMLLRTVIGTPVALECARWLMFAGKFGVSAAFASIWIFAAELFPTSLRTIALGMGSMSGRVGGILSPQINQLYLTVPWLPPLIYGCVCIAGGTLSLALPETAGRPLLNTISEAEEFYRR